MGDKIDRLKDSEDRLDKKVEHTRENKWSVANSLDRLAKRRHDREHARHELQRELGEVNRKLAEEQTAHTDARWKELRAERDRLEDRITDTHGVVERFNRKIKKRRDRYHKLEGRVRYFVERLNKVSRKKKKAIAAQKKDDAPSPTGSGITTFDGKQCASWIAAWLQRSRAAGWDGVLVSGYRSPAYSTQLCMNMCGAPSCPGRCAGASSNHSGSAYPRGAVDVSYYWQFGAIQRQIGSPLKNGMPSSDPVHYSFSGF